MADVIRLQDRAPRSPKTTDTTPLTHSNAVVLLFTGIRYERLEGHSDAVNNALHSTTTTH